MKLMHLSDLHLGRRLNDVSLIEDQKYILQQILNIVDQEQPQAVLICGDVYDKSVPSAEAVELLDDFLWSLSLRHTQVFVISGNHDSAERLAFGGRLMKSTGIHLSPVYSSAAAPISLTDEFGTVNFHMLPFVKPAHVRRYHPEAEISGYTDALAAAVADMNIDLQSRNILLTHQFVTGASRCDSEELSVGGSDNVDASVFGGFDYVALGHIHGPQNIVPGKIRYCGTPLKYSFSECHHQKSVTMVELQEKGQIHVSTIPLVPMRDLREIKGTYLELTDKKNYENTATEDYLHIILTDEEDVPEAVSRLRVIYPNLLKLSYDNLRTRTSQIIDTVDEIQQKTPLELFCQLYELQNNQPMTEQQLTFTQNLIESIWEEYK